MRTRLYDLLALQARVRVEIAKERARLARAERNRTRVRRSRYERPPCGTEQGYQWHRYREPRVTCTECRAAHSRHVVNQQRERRLLRRAAS